MLAWDQQTYMPAGGAAARAEQMATLQKTAHTWFIADEIGEMLEALSKSGSDWDYDSDEASLVRVVGRDYQKARKIPPDLVAELARVSALAYEAWVKARQESDFSQFQPHLERIVDLNIQVAEALGYEDRIYDPLLDQYEPEMKTDQVVAPLRRAEGGDGAADQGDLRDGRCCGRLDAPQAHGCAEAVGFWGASDSGFRF